MFELLKLSDELLICIAYHLRYHPSGVKTAYAGLTHLSLTCRRLHRIAQEIIYQDVAIPINLSAPRASGLTSLSLFLRSILEHQDLADRVKALQIEAVNVRNSMFSDCMRSGPQSAIIHGENCPCGWTSLANLIINFFRENPSFRRMKIDDSNWWDKIATGNQSLLIGIILRRLSALRSLHLDIYSTDYDQQFRSQGVYQTDVFGYLLLENDFKPANILGLHNVTEISSINTIAPEFMELHKLESLQIGLDHDRHWSSDPRMCLWYKPKDFQISTTVKSLTVLLNISDLAREAYLGGRGKYTHLNRLIGSLVNLKRLLIRFTYQENLDRRNLNESNNGSYAHIIPIIESSSIECVTIDTANIETAVKIREVDCPNGFLTNLRPISSLQRLPQLRQLTAPVAAFFSVDSLFEICPLPSTIERIGIIDSMSSTNRYAQFLLQNREQWPGLSEINLWQDAFDLPLADDCRIVRGAEIATNVEANDDGNNTNDIWKLAFDVRDDVWKELQSAGIRVSKHRESKGWREKSATAGGL